MNLDFLKPHHPRWLEFLDGVPHQFYHLPGYAELWAGRDAGAAEAVLVTDGNDYFFVPYSILSLDDLQGVNDLQGQFYDLRSPYGYPGPLIRAESRGFLSCAVEAWTAAMRARRVVSGFVRLDPLASEVHHLLADHGQLCPRSETVSVDLTAVESNLWTQIRSSKRQNIKSARAAGFTVDMRSGGEQIEVFQSIYYETMDRVNAASDYYFPPEHFRDLVDLLGNKLWIGIVNSPAGEALSAGMFIEHKGVVQYHLGGARAAARPLRLTELLIYSAMLSAKARGNHSLHLGGGRGSARDSLFAFKAGFSKLRHRFSTWHVVFLPEAYQSLLMLRGTASQPESSAEFFPAYRS